MSYNIDTMKLKRLENFIIPLAALYECEREDWKPSQPEILDILKPDDIVIEFGCGQSISGTLTNGELCVTKMDIIGEGSGTAFEWILKGAFQKSRGTLEAVLIWEGGDSITKLLVENGNLTNDDIDI